MFNLMFCLLVGLVLSAASSSTKPTPLYFDLGSEWQKQELIDRLRNDRDVLKFMLKSERFEKGPGPKELNTVYVNGIRAGFIYKNPSNEIKVNIGGETILLFVTEDQMHSKLTEEEEKAKMRTMRKEAKPRPLSFPRGTTIDEIVSTIKTKRDILEFLAEPDLFDSSSENRARNKELLTIEIDGEKLGYIFESRSSGHIIAKINGRDSILFQDQRAIRDEILQPAEVDIVVPPSKPTDSAPLGPSLPEAPIDTIPMFPDSAAEIEEERENPVITEPSVKPQEHEVVKEIAQLKDKGLKKIKEFFFEKENASVWTEEIENDEVSMQNLKDIKFEFTRTIFKDTVKIHATHLMKALKDVGKDNLVKIVSKNQGENLKFRIGSEVDIVSATEKHLATRAKYIL